MDPIDCIEGSTGSPHVFHIKYPECIKGVSSKLLDRDLAYNFTKTSCTTLEGEEVRYGASWKFGDFGVLVKCDGTMLFINISAYSSIFKKCDKREVHASIIEHFNL